MRRFAAFLAAVVISSAGSVLTTHQAYALNDWLPDIASSSVISGPVLAEGTVVSAAGAPVGAMVVAVAWPRRATLAALKDGDHFRRLIVSKDLTGSDGKFTLRVDPNVAMAGYTESDGTVNFEVLAETPDGSAAYGLPGRLDSKVPAWVVPGASSGAATTQPMLVLRVSGRSGGAAAPVEALAPAPADKTDCDDVLIATYNTVPAIIGESYAGINATAQFTYLSGSSSTVGWGASISGGFGTYSQSGTSSASSSTSLSYPQKPRDSKYVYKSTWQYKKFATYAFQPFTTPPCHFLRYVVRETAFGGGASGYDAAATPNTPYCQGIGAGVTVTKNSATAVTFTNGVDISGQIGVDLSSRTGYNTSTSVTFYFVYNGSLCGDISPGYTVSSRVKGL